MESWIGNRHHKSPLFLCTQFAYIPHLLCFLGRHFLFSARAEIEVQTMMGGPIVNADFHAEFNFASAPTNVRYCIVHSEQ